MKRLAILLLLAAFPGSATRLTAADFALPLPTGIAPTSPQVPVPVIVDGLPVAVGGDWSRTSFRDRLGIAPTHVVAAEAVAGPRMLTRVASWMPIGKKNDGSEAQDSWHAKPKWCEQCAPAVRHPLPPLPAGMSANRGYSTAACTSTSCAPAQASGSCCAKLKDWFCCRPSTVRTPCIPTQKEPATYTYFTPQEGLGVGVGNCATGNCATGKFGHGSGKNCVACPVPGEALVPGYRLAN